MGEQVLMVMVAGERAAIRAAEVNTIVELETIARVPRAPAHFLGISALRSKPLFVIDCAAALNRGEARAAPEGFGVVVIKDGHAYALAVEDVLHLAEMTEGPASAGIELCGAWQELCEGEIVTDHGTLMLVDPMRIIDGPQPAAEAA